jgi:hypothetical protein
MPANNLTPAPDSSARRRARLRTIGILVLLLGLAGAGTVYWTGAPPADLSADPSTARAYKTAERTIEINSGKLGVLLNDLTEDLKRPGTQALIILAVSILVASGCFYFARWLEPGGEPDDPVA